MAFIRVVPAVPAILTGLSKFTGALRSTREPMAESVKTVIIPRIRQNFLSESDAAGNRWAPLSDIRIARTSLGVYYNPILVMTGKLRDRAIQTGMWEFEGQESRMAMRAPTPYAAIQNFGGTNRGLGGRFGPIPARPFANINEFDMQRIEENIMNFAAERLVI